MKVRQIVTLKGWENGNGYTYSTCYEDKIIDIAPNELEREMDWSWWDVSKNTADKDTEIIVEYFPKNYDPLENKVDPLARWSTWESEI